MKKTLSIVLCLSIIAAGVMILAACGRQNADDTNKNTGEIESGEQIGGGWTAAGSPVITDAFTAVFEKAAAGIDGVDYTPVAYLAGRSGAGTEHCVLCKATPVVPDAQSTYSIVYISEDADGGAEITKIIGSEAETQDHTYNVPGGWSETGSPEMTDDAKKALEKACETLTGAVYTPVALLATQVVAGMNYRIVCESRPSVPSAERGYAIVTVYADLDGNAKITDTMEFRLEDTSESGPEKSETTAAAAGAVDGNIKTYYEMGDGTWTCDGVNYKYRLEISGRMPNAAVDSTFVYLSNLEEISFEQAYKAAGISSASADYFSPEEAVLVEMN